MVSRVKGTNVAAIEKKCDSRLILNKLPDLHNEVIHPGSVGDVAIFVASTNEVELTGKVIVLDRGFIIEGRISGGIELAIDEDI